MLVKLMNPVGKMEKVRAEDVQYYLDLGYTCIADPAQELETVELMSPAGKVVVMQKDVNDYLQKEGWGLLVEEVPTEDETPEPSAGDETSETPEEPEKPVEDEIPAIPTDGAPVEEPESVQESEPEPEIASAENVSEEAEETTE